MTSLDKFKYSDPGDKHDPFKWDFNESNGYITIVINSYPYKVLKKRKKEDQIRIATKLHRLRLLNDKITKDLSKYATGPGIKIYKTWQRNTKSPLTNLLCSTTFVAT